MNLRLTQKAPLWAILAGISYVLCFPRYDLPFLSVLFLPLALFSIHNLKSARQAVALGFLLSAMVAWGGFHWIAYVAQNFGQMPFPVAIGLLCLFCLVAAPQMVAFFGLGYFARGPVERLPVMARPVFWAAAYVFLEYLARFLKIFPEHLGNTLIAYPAIAQGASLGGVSLLTFLPAFIGAALFYVRKVGGRAAWASLALSVVLILGVKSYGNKRLEAIAAEPSETLRVGFVQHNMEEVEKIAQRTSGTNAFDQIVTRLVSKNRELSEGARRPDLLLWPETAYPLVFPTPSGRSRNWLAEGYANLIRANISELGVPLLFGGYETNGQQDFNAAILLGADGAVRATYRKFALLVFGEYMPFADWVPALKTLNPQMGDFGVGAGPVPLPFRHGEHDIPLGVNICYEAILPDYMRAMRVNGARLFVNLTKDSWFGDTFEPWQHLQLTALRSVEHGIPMVRVTNTGLSGVITPTGATQLLSLPFREAYAVVDVAVPLNPAPTVYTRLGEWFAWSCLLIALALGTWAFRKRA
jgi:apolipoprotein N-acyltransferase